MGAVTFAADPVLVADFKTLSTQERLTIRSEARAVVSGASTSMTSLGLSDTVDLDHARTVLASIIQAEAELATEADGGLAEQAQRPLAHGFSFYGTTIQGM